MKKKRLKKRVMELERISDSMADWADELMDKIEILQAQNSTLESLLSGGEDSDDFVPGEKV